MTEERRVQLVAEVDTTRTRAGFTEIGQQANTMAQQVAQAGDRAERAVNNVGTGASTTSRNVDAAQRNIIAAIQRTTTAMEAGGRQTAAYYELLARQRGVDPSVLSPYIAQLRAVEQAQSRTAASAGASAGQIAAAMRTVPAQFTDIVTALQGGQQPLTVLLQQGGQLRDQFGSAGTAARALGGYVLGLVNPYTIAAGAVGVLALAYKSGADESEAFRRALILSGNAAGATSGQLEDMRRNVAAISGSRDAAAALAQLVQTAQVPAESLQQFAMLAVDVQRVLGRSVEETVAEFEKLGKSPLQALSAIDDKYHFINASTYAQVKALQDQGKATEAANVAQQAYAAGVQEQKDKVLATLNSWEKAWLGLKMYAADAANAVVDFAGGRDTSNMEKINALLKERDGIEADRARAQARGLAADVAAYDAQLDANKRAINAIRDRGDAEKARAKAEADAQKVDDARKQWLKDGEQYLTRQAQLERDVTKARNEGATAGLSSTEIEKRVADIRKSYADIFNAGIDSNIEALKRRDQVADVLEQREIARIAAARAAGSMMEDDAINATASTELAAFGRKRALLEAELDLTKKKANSVKEQADLEGQIAVLDEQRKSRSFQLTNDLFAAEQKRYRQAVNNSADAIEREMAELAGLRQQTQAQYDYNDAIGLSQKQVAALTAAHLEEAAARKDAEANIAEGLDLTGERAARIRDEAAAIRERAAALLDGAEKQQRYDNWKQAVDQYGQVFQQGFADMLNNGNAGWQSFTKSLVSTFKTSVADQIYKMFARPIIVQLVGSYLGVSQTAIAGEIASQPNGYGITAGSGPIGAAQAASSLYSTVTGGMTLAGGLGTGFMGSLAGGLTGAGAGSGLTSSLGLSIGNGILDVVGPGISSALASGMGAIATALPWVGGAVAVASLWKSAFGHGDTEVQGQGIRGTLSASGVSGQSYQNLHQDGGWFSSDRDWEKATDFTGAMSKQFTNGLQSMETAAAGFASSLGVSADWVTTYSKTFDLALTGDATKDQQIITDFFTGVGDEIANKLVPNLTDFAKSGEAASATLERLAGDFKGTDQIAQLLGRSASTLFGATGIESAKARESLIDFAGGLSTLSSEASFFNQNFLTDAERIKPVAEALDKALGSLGLDTIPTTRDQFKSLINSLIDSGAAATDAGAKQLSSLLALGEAFAQVHPDETAAAAERAAKVLQERQGLQEEYDQLTKTSAQLLGKQRDALEDSNKELFDQIQALKDQASAIQSMKDAASTLLGGVDNAFSALQKVVAREKAAVQASVTTQTAVVTKLQTLSQALRSTLDSLKSPDQKAAERASAQAQIRAALAIAKAGGALPSADSLKNALSAVADNSSDQFATYQDYLRDLYQTQNDISALAGITDDQLSVAEKSLDVLQDQLSSLDDQLAAAQDQVDILKGIDTNGLSLLDAMRGLTTAILQAQSNPIVGATGAINGAYQQYLGRTPDAPGLEWWQNAAANGAPVSQIVDGIKGSTEATLNTLYRQYLGRVPDADGLAFWMRNYGSTMDETEKADWLKAAQKDPGYKIPGFATGGDFAGGLRWVGEVGPEVEATGAARIHSTRALVDALRSPSGNADALAAAVDRLQATVAQQRQVIERMASDMEKMAGTLNGASVNGGVLRVKVIN
jgi:phage-related minor tail protein